MRVLVSIALIFTAINPNGTALQGVLVSQTSSSDGGGSVRFLLDDGTGVIELHISRDFLTRPWEVGRSSRFLFFSIFFFVRRIVQLIDLSVVRISLGMYVMVVGCYLVREGDLPMIKV